ncbi:unnamed protein product [Fraxinus pennsylvanica]|uniref:Protein kinase domain-containing protein n=1 Tax=Fraxinus pennsylvanica TaxID=56036 RepID=A0AAD1YR72_9LAMI|nr:unnamed protein product [Fraxinus pennsylvanica]
MSCFSCMTPRRKNARDYDEDMTLKSTGSSDQLLLGFAVGVNGKADFSERSGGKGSSAGARDIDNNGQKSNVACSFTFKELALATQNFRESNLIGEGGFGNVVAVKQLNLEGLQGNQEFIVEVLMLSLLHHPNLVNLIGYCAHGDQRLLVYEYMPLGSLEYHLFGNPLLLHASPVGV